MRQNVKRVLTGLPAVLLLTGCDEQIVNAGYNTLLGMGMAFFVLIIISLVISLLSVINRTQETKKTDGKDIRRQAVDNAVKQIEKQEQVAAAPAAAAAPAVAAYTTPGIPTNDGGEMLAVFAAAIATYEAEMATGAQAGGTVTAAGHPAAAFAAQQPLPDLSGWDGLYVRPMNKHHAVNWKKA